MDAASEIVDELISLDGVERWQLYRDDNGLYSASVHTLGRAASRAGEDRAGVDIDTEQHWMPGRSSGPFATVEAAQHDALDNLPWFFEAQTSDTNGS